MNLIEAKNLSKSYGLIRKKFALRNASFTISEAECKAIVGPNGAGKTTFLKILSGVITNFSGQVERNAPLSYCSEISLGYPFLTSSETLEYYRHLVHSKVNIGDVLQLVGLEDHDTLVSQYSKGMKRKLEIARALILDAKLLILDEPFDGLDPMAAREISDLLVRLKRDGRGMVVSSHDLYRLQDVADEIYFISKGSFFRNERVDSIRRFKIEFLKGTLKESLLMYTIKHRFEISGNVLFVYGITVDKSWELLSGLFEMGVKILSADFEPLENEFWRTFH